MYLADSYVVLSFHSDQSPADVQVLIFSIVTSAYSHSEDEVEGRCSASRVALRPLCHC